MVGLNIFYFIYMKRDWAEHRCYNGFNVAEIVGLDFHFQMYATRTLAKMVAHANGAKVVLPVYVNLVIQEINVRPVSIYLFWLC